MDAVDKIRAWLKEDSDVGVRLERLGYLVASNGGSFEVKFYGNVVVEDGIRHGLTQNEAIELIHFSQFINGVNFLDDRVWPVVTEMVTEWIKARYKKHAAKQRSKAASKKNKTRAATKKRRVKKKVAKKSKKKTRK